MGKLMLGGFCDWISVSQQHEIGSFADYSQSRYMVIDSSSGEVEISKNNPVQLTGSYDTSIRIQCNNGRVSLSGNVGRFGRPDNLAGFSLDTVKHKTNEILSMVGLPPFSAGSPVRLHSKNGISRVTYTGAKISRVDITTNICADSNLDRCMHSLSQHHESRRQTKTYGDNETIYYGNSLRRTKIYRKAPELRRHNKLKLRYVSTLADWCDSQGIMRHETTFTERYLNRNGLKPWHKCTDQTIHSHYLDELKILDNITMERTDLENLPAPVVGTYHAYINGVDCATVMTKSTFYRHRKILKPFGIDIAVKTNIVRLQTKPVNLNLYIPEFPDFYDYQVA